MAGIDVLGVGQGPSFVSGDYLSATCIQDQIINTPYETKSVEAFSLDYSNGISISGTFNERFLFSKTGIYNVQFSLQVTNDSPQAHLFYVWGAINNTAILSSCSVLTVHSTHGGNKGHMIAALNLFISVTSGQFFTLNWTADNILVQLENLGSPGFGIPNSPSAILTITEV